MFFNVFIFVYLKGACWKKQDFGPGVASTYTIWPILNLPIATNWYAWTCERWCIYVDIPILYMTGKQYVRVWKTWTQTLCPSTGSLQVHRHRGLFGDNPDLIPPWLLFFYHVSCVSHRLPHKCTETEVDLVETHTGPTQPQVQCGDEKQSAPLTCWVSCNRWVSPHFESNNC